VTIVGPGGIGKTKVVLAAAERMIARYEHGVWLVDLAPLGDPRLVPGAVATVLGLDIRTEDPLPGLVVLDLKMPVLDGQSTLVQIKGDIRLKKIPVVIYSTSSNDQDRRKCMVNGALEYFIKPSSYLEGEAMASRLMEFLQ